MQPDNSDASKAALALLRSDGVCNFDLTVNGARLRPIRFGSHAAAPSENVTATHLSVRRLAAAGPLAKIGNSFGDLSSSGCAIA